MNEFVADSVRDAVIQQLLTLPENKVSTEYGSHTKLFTYITHINVYRCALIARVRTQSGVQATLGYSCVTSAHRVIEISVSTSHLSGKFCVSIFMTQENNTITSRNSSTSCILLRSLNAILTSYRSLKMDKWKRKELKQMELGGNKNAQIYYESKNMYKDGKPDHEAPPHSVYKKELAAKAEQAVRAELG